MAGGDDNKRDEEWLTTGEMARLSQTTLRTVRFYESEGLISPRERADGSHRKFPRSELDKLQIISDLRDAGLSLPEIKALIAVKSGCETAREAATQVGVAVDTRLEDIERRIAALARVRTELLQFKGMLRTCGECTRPDFAQRCHDCPDVSEHKGAERATQLLWKH